jgi:hypothetical protein
MHNSHHHIRFANINHSRTMHGQWKDLPKKDSDTQEIWPPHSPLRISPHSCGHRAASQGHRAAGEGRDVVRMMHYLLIPFPNFHPVLPPSVRTRKLSQPPAANKNQFHNKFADNHLRKSPIRSVRTNWAPLLSYREEAATPMTRFPRQPQSTAPIFIFILSASLQKWKSRAAPGRTRKAIAHGKAS